MLTREIGAGSYDAGCSGAPPPLHVHPNTLGASWFPVERTVYEATPDTMFFVGQPIVAPFGDDPTDPAMQQRTHRHHQGMIARFNVGGSGVRGPVKP